MFLHQLKESAEKPKGTGSGSGGGGGKDGGSTSQKALKFGSSSIASQETTALYNKTKKVNFIIAI